MTSGREIRMSTLRRDTLKGAGSSPKSKTVGAFNDKRWGKNISTPMSRIKAQASSRKQLITLPKVNLPE